MAVRHRIGRLWHRAGVVRRRREAVRAVAVDHQAPDPGKGRRRARHIGRAADHKLRHRQAVAIHVRVIRQDIARSRRVFIDTRRVIDPNRRVIHRNHRDGQRRAARPAMAVRHRIGRHRHRAIVVRYRREAVRAVAVDHQAPDPGKGRRRARRIGRAIDHKLRHRQAVALNVRVIRQDIARSRRVFIGRGRIRNPNRRVIHRNHRDGGAIRVREAAARPGVAVVARHHGQGDRAIAIGNRRIARRRPRRQIGIEVGQRPRQGQCRAARTRHRHTTSRRRRQRPRRHRQRHGHRTRPRIHIGNRQTRQLHRRVLIGRIAGKRVHRRVIHRSGGDVGVRHIRIDRAVIGLHGDVAHCGARIVARVFKGYGADCRLIVGVSGNPGEGNNRPRVGIADAVDGARGGRRTANQQTVPRLGVGKRDYTGSHGGAASVTNAIVGIGNGNRRAAFRICHRPVVTRRCILNGRGICP